MGSLRRRVLRVAALASATVFVVTSCSSIDSGDEGGGGGEGGQAGGELVDSTPLGDDFDPAAVFSWGYTVGPSSMDPHRGSSGFDQNWLFPAYDRLIYMSPAGEPEPMLATEWELSEDARTIDMELREGVVFHDGTEMDAEAVKTSLDRARTDEMSNVAPLLASIESVEVTGPLSVAINLNEPNAALLPNLGDRAGMIISPTALENPDLDRYPVGAGPYRVVDYRDGDRVVYEKFEDYWDPEIQRTAGLEYRIMADDETRLNAIRAGEVHIGIVRESQIPSATQMGLNILDGPRGSYYYFSVNSSMAPFDDPLVRRAVNHALNRVEIGDGILQGYCTPTVQPWPENSWAYDEDLGPGVGEGEYGEHNVELARELLAEAGHPDGFAFDAVVANITGYVTIAEAVQAQLADAGITMNIRQVEAAQASEVYNVEQQVPAAVLSYEPTMDESGPLVTHYLPGALGNPGGLTSPELERLFDEQNSQISPEDRAPIFHEIMAELTDLDMHEMVLCMRRRQEVFQPGLMGLNIYPTGARDYRGVAVSTELSDN
ncbi:ABC transporter substrate-binding protein [Blastococcus sp. SYSU DS0616]